MHSRRFERTDPHSGDSHRDVRGPHKSDPLDIRDFVRHDYAQRTNTDPAALKIDEQTSHSEYHDDSGYSSTLENRDGEYHDSGYSSMLQSRDDGYHDDSGYSTMHENSDGESANEERRIQVKQTSFSHGETNKLNKEEAYPGHKHATDNQPQSAHEKQMEVIKAQAAKIESDTKESADAMEQEQKEMAEQEQQYQQDTQIRQNRQMMQQQYYQQKQQEKAQKKQAGQGGSNQENPFDSQSDQEGAFDSLLARRRNRGDGDDGYDGDDDDGYDGDGGYYDDDDDDD